VADDDDDDGVGTAADSNDNWWWCSSMTMRRMVLSGTERPKMATRALLKRLFQVGPIVVHVLRPRQHEFTAARSTHVRCLH